MKKLTKKTTALLCNLALAIILFVSAGCSGCVFMDAINSVVNGNYWLQFRNSRITMSVGENVTFDRSDFMFEDGEPEKDWSFTLESDDIVVADVAGTTLYALSKGSAKIKATAKNGKKATLSVTVVEDVEQITLGFPYGSALKAGGDKLIDVTVVDKAGKIDLSDYQVASWKINGVEQNFYGKTLTLPNNGAEVFLIEVEVFVPQSGGKVKTLSAKANACYYSGGYVKPKIGVSNLSPAIGEKVDFSVESGENYVVDLYINGSLVSESAHDYSFTPEKAGYYGYEAYCYEECVASGVISVIGAPEVDGVSVDVDKKFPDTVVTWNSLGNDFDYEIRVEQNGNVNTFTTDDNSAIIDVDVTGDFTVNVRSLGDGVMQETQFGDNPVVYSGSRDALGYLQKTWHGGNYYLSDAKEFYEFFDYMLYYRPQPEAGSFSKSENTVYLAFEGDVNELLDRSFAWSGATGSYTLYGERSGNIATVTMEFYTGNIPSQRSEYNKVYHDRPADMAEYHVSSTGGGVSYFAKANRGDAVVSTSEQLFRVAELGYTPRPEEGSTAESLLYVAENILDEILDDEMTEFEIAHAIYDCIMAKNTYDSSVLDIELESAVNHRSFYLEALLCYGENYGVCDAIAKTYSLLCNMAGLDCVRVTGYAGVNGNYGGHAWNKVKVDGKWYVVDCTWGDVSVYYKTGRNGSATEYRESASHTYFLVSDSDVADTHVQDLGEYPRTDKVGYGAYGKILVAGGNSDLVVQESGSKLYAELDKIALGVANSAGSRYVRLCKIVRESKISGTDFIVSDGSLESAIEYLSSKNSNFFKLITGKNLNYTVLNDGNVFYVMVSDSVNMTNMTLNPSSGGQAIRPPWIDWFL